MCFYMQFFFNEISVIRSLFDIKCMRMDAITNLDIIFFQISWHDKPQILARFSSGQKVWLNRKVPSFIY